MLIVCYGLPWWLVVKNPPANAGEVGLIPGSERPLEKEMATHSSVLAWEIPWTEETGQLQSMSRTWLGTAAGDGLARSFSKQIFEPEYLGSKPTLPLARCVTLHMLPDLSVIVSSLENGGNKSTCLIGKDWWISVKVEKGLGTYPDKY